MCTVLAQTLYANTVHWVSTKCVPTSSRSCVLQLQQKAVEKDRPIKTFFSCTLLFACQESHDNMATTKFQLVQRLTPVVVFVMHERVTL